MNRLTLAVTAVAVVFCISAGPDDVAPAKPDKEAIVGTWKWVSVMDQGMKMAWPEENRLVITAETMTMVYPKDTSTGWKYTIDSSKDPRQMDWLPEEDPGHPILNPAIYSLDGDTLKIASTAQGKPRPANFESKKGDFGGVWILKRVILIAGKEAAK